MKIIKIIDEDLRDLFSLPNLYSVFEVFAIILK